MTSVRYGDAASRSSTSMPNSRATRAKSARRVARSGAAGREHERDPHEEPALELVAELLALHDVAAVADEEAGDRVHDAGPVRAGQREDVVAGRGLRPGWGDVDHDQPRGVDGRLTG